MPSCPSGHNSTASDLCDVCGLRLQTYTSPKTPELRPTVAPWSHGPEQWFSEDETGGSCPECGTARAGRFCEECGYDFVLRYEEHQHGPGTGEDAVWRVVVAADPAYYQYMVDRGMLAPEQLVFPSNSRRRRILLEGDKVHIGRSSPSRGFIPEIDLGGVEGDPAISHLHALLLSRPGDRWALLDLGSTNGTTINGTGDPITPNVEVPLNDNDRIYVGAWTVIILYKR